VRDYTVAMKREALEERLRDAFSRHAGGITAAYLFGSHAAGREHRESDIDVGVILDRVSFPTSEARFEERLRLLARLPQALSGAEVDVVILNDSPPGLGRRIVLEGRRVFCSDAEGDHAFRRDVQLRAADLEPFLRRARQIKLATLSR